MLRNLLLKTAFLLVSLLSMLASSRSAVSAAVPLTAGMKITQHTTIAPGTYTLTDPGNGIVQISGSNFVVDLKGAKLVASEVANPQSTIVNRQSTIRASARVSAREGHNRPSPLGLHITDARNVTIKNAEVSGCLWGIVIERSVGVKLIHCVTSRNADLPPGTVIDESGREPEDTHGGGIVLRDSRDCLVQHCVSQHQWDGIDVVRSEHNVIEDGDFSYNGNWGLHLWNSARNTFRRNRAVWCTTGEGTLFQALTGWQTYDAQAVGIDHNSNENLIEANDLRFGGDAIFIRANEGPITPGTVVPPRNGSHRNVLRNNDCSFSPNNAIEVDLVDDTVIEGNNCSFSNYGMWLGYSRRCVVRNNICINDSSKAVEIENGQGDVFENNLFGYDTPRPEALIFLRQNGRDPTPSGPYTFNWNGFYGSSRPLVVRSTAGISLSHTRIFNGGAYNGEMLTDEQGHSVPFIGNSNLAGNEPFESRPAPTLVKGGLRPGSLCVLSAPWLAADLPYVVEIDGIPAWVRKAENHRLTFWMPADFCDRPARSTASLRILSLTGSSPPITVPIVWPDNHLPRIDNIAPNPARIGDTITLTGQNLAGEELTRVLFNNKSGQILQATPTKIMVQLPTEILTPTRYNVLVVRGVGATTLRSWPIVVAVDVPPAQQPHILNATFSPTTLRVGELLHVTFTVRNNLPTPARLLTTPGPNFTYEEKQSINEMGMPETPGTLHLRVTSDHPGPHEPGSWPYRFGFAQSMLAPGETVTVEGNIRVETPGTHEFRVGLVASGFRFIDDNAFRTKIVVLPRP